MSEEAKKGIAGPLTARPNTDDRKPLPLPAPAVPPKKVIIKSADMIPDMQKEAVDIAVAAFEKYNVEKDVAEQVKKEFDKRHGPTWHCIVGRNFVKERMIGQAAYTLDLSAHASWSYLAKSSQIPCRVVGIAGSYVTHETNHFVYFYLDQKAVLLFKSG
ncbi:hypothetical protein ACSQ67_020306 [Phaseolus vulgaris]